MRSYRANIGRLNKYVQVQKEVKASDGMGGFTVTWQNDSSIWASVEEVSQNRSLDFGQTNFHLQYKVIIRVSQTVVHADFSEQDFNSLDFQTVTSVSNNLKGHYRIVYQGAKIYLHAIRKLDNALMELTGYSRET